MGVMHHRGRWFWALSAAVLLTDCATKRVAESTLAPAHIPHPLIDHVVRLTLAYNTGSAMSLWSGTGARVVLSVLAVLGLAIVLRLYWRTAPGERLRIAGLALVAGGAAGNLVDRLRSGRGVVDFIDVGLGSWRFWTFNVADIAVTIGASLLVWALGREEARSGSSRTAA